MAIVPAAGLSKDQKTLRDARRVLAFQCKCGCELFHIDVEVYEDYSWAPIVFCAACKKICVPTEPVTNGPH